MTKGDRIPFVLTWFESHKDPPRKIHAEHALRDTETFWTDWAKQFQTEGRWRDAIVRSLITLKGLTYAPTGGLVAALTTSLPEQIGGVRNWDYRLLAARRGADFRSTRGGLSRRSEIPAQWQSVPSQGAAQMQTIYGVRGERRRLVEYEIPWLSGYEDSRPVRLVTQCQRSFSSTFMASVGRGMAGPSCGIRVMNLIGRSWSR